jgi:hypothetical protein
LESVFTFIGNEDSTAMPRLAAFVYRAALLQSPGKAGDNSIPTFLLGERR